MAEILNCLVALALLEEQHKKAAEMAQAKLKGTLRTLKERKLYRRSVVRVIEYEAGANSMMQLLKAARFRNVIARKMPNPEAHTETELKAFSEISTSSFKGLPVEILAFK